MATENKQLLCDMCVLDLIILGATVFKYTLLRAFWYCFFGVIWSPLVITAEILVTLFSLFYIGYVITHGFPVATNERDLNGSEWIFGSMAVLIAAMLYQCIWLDPYIVTSRWPFKVAAILVTLFGLFIADCTIVDLYQTIFENSERKSIARVTIGSVVSIVLFEHTVIGVALSWLYHNVLPLLAEVGVTLHGVLYVSVALYDGYKFVKSNANRNLFDIDKTNLFVVILAIPKCFILYQFSTVGTVFLWLVGVIFWPFAIISDLGKTLLYHFTQSSTFALWIIVITLLTVFFVTSHETDASVQKTITELFHRTSHGNYRYDYNTNISVARSRVRVRRITKLNNKHLEEAYKAHIRHMPTISHDHRSLDVDDQTRCCHLFLSSAKDTLLFHATPEANVASITENGFRIDRFRRGIYGKGIYFTDCSHKADGYSGQGPERYMFVARVALGEIVHHNTGGAGGHSCIAARHDHYTEFLAFENSQCLPVYLIEYEHV